MDIASFEKYGAHPKIIQHLGDERLQISDDDFGCLLECVIQRADVHSRRGTRIEVGGIQYQVIDSAVGKSFPEWILAPLSLFECIACGYESWEIDFKPAWACPSCKGIGQMTDKADITDKHRASRSFTDQ